MHPNNKSREHQANERTFLAWIRTSIGIMAFGFVVVKFSLFIRQLGFIFGKSEAIPTTGYSPLIGIFLVAFGPVIALLAYFQYRRVEKQLRQNEFTPSPILPILALSFLLLMDGFLVVYLVSGV